MKTERFLGDLHVKLRKYPVNGKWFQLIRDFYYYAEDGNIYTIPSGIDTDFASIPRGMRWLIPRVGDHGMAAVMHDWLCEYKIVNRKKADKLFLEAMKTSGVRWLKRRTMYFGVRTYSIFSFKK
jgi:hypothetical protein